MTTFARERMRSASRPTGNRTTARTSEGLTPITLANALMTLDGDCPVENDRSTLRRTRANVTPMTAPCRRASPADERADGGVDVGVGEREPRVLEAPRDDPLADQRALIGE